MFCLFSSFNSGGRFLSICALTHSLLPSGLPRVRFLCGVAEVLKPERWVFKSGGGVHLSRQQLPLKLAWAISIHKSQVSTGTITQSTRILRQMLINSLFE